MLKPRLGFVRYLSTNSIGPRRTAKGRLMDSIIRVDHAGEFGADRIYAGQMAVLGKTASLSSFDHNSKYVENLNPLF